MKCVRLELCSSVALILLLASPGLAFNPGTATRTDNTASNAGSTTVCENGNNDGTTCTSGAQCTGGGTCTDIADVQIVARGTLTLVADTQTANTGWADTAPSVACTEPSTGTPSDCETEDTAIFTLILEFTLGGVEYTFAESFRKLDACLSPPCDFVIQNWSEGAGWVQPAVESTLAERTTFGDPVLIRWGVLPPAAENAIGAVLGKSPTQRLALSRVDDVPICTDATACNHGPRNTLFADHASGSDVLATVRRYKVDLALVGP